MDELDLEFGVSINPHFIPEEKEGISKEGWGHRLDDGLIKYDIRTREYLYGPHNEIKMMLSGRYEDIKGFLEYVYGYIDYSCIYLWSAHVYDLVHYYKTQPRKNLEVWRLL